jgi:hypothetical protein
MLGAKDSLPLQQWRLKCVNTGAMRSAARAGPSTFAKRVQTARGQDDLQGEITFMAYPSSCRSSAKAAYLVEITLY